MWFSAFLHILIFCRKKKSRDLQKRCFFSPKSWKIWDFPLGNPLCARNVPKNPGKSQDFPLENPVCANHVPNNVIFQFSGTFCAKICDFKLKKSGKKCKKCDFQLFCTFSFFSKQKKKSRDFQKMRFFSKNLAKCQIFLWEIPRNPREIGISDFWFSFFSATFPLATCPFNEQISVVFPGISWFLHRFFPCFPLNDKIPVVFIFLPWVSPTKRETPEIFPVPAENPGKSRDFSQKSSFWQILPES